MDTTRHDPDLHSTSMAPAPAPAHDLPTAHPTPAPIPAYHRLARAHPRYRWWKPLLTLPVAVLLWFVLIVTSGIVANLVSGRDLFGTLDVDALPLDDPLALALQLWFVIAMAPATWLAVRLVQGRGPGTLSSVVGRLRWGLLARCTVVATALVGTSMVLGPLLGGSPTPVTPPATGSRLLVMLAVVVVLVPLQASAEEVVFRGLLVQTVGAWVRPAWIAVLVQVPIFALGHAYGWKGMLDVSIFALVTGWLTVRTGGLEAGIALHAVNNVLAFTWGVLGWSDPGSDDVSLWALALSQILTLCYAVLVEGIGQRRGWWAVGTAGTAGRSRLCQSASSRRSVS